MSGLKKAHCPLCLQPEAEYCIHTLTGFYLPRDYPKHSAGTVMLTEFEADHRRRARRIPEPRERPKSQS